FADALAGGPAAAKTGGPVLLVDTNAIPGATAGELTRLKPGRIVVLGGEGAVSAAVFDALRGYTGGGVTRVARAARSGTAAATAVAFDAFPNASTAFVATGLNFPDALAGGVLAGRSASPLLLVPGTVVPYAVRGQVNRLRPRVATMLGGPSALGDLVEFQAGY